MTDTALSRGAGLPRLSVDQLERSRKFHGLILNGLAREGQVHVADAIGVHESTVSKWKDGDLERFAQILAVVGLKVVPASQRCYDAAEIDALLVLARQRLVTIGGAEQLGSE